MQLISKSRAKPEEGNIPIEHEPKTLTAVELFATAIEERDLGRPLGKKSYKIGDKELLVCSCTVMVLFLFQTTHIVS